MYDAGTFAARSVPDGLPPLIKLLPRSTSDDVVVCGERPATENSERGEVVPMPKYPVLLVNESCAGFAVIVPLLSLTKRTPFCGSAVDVVKSGGETVQFVLVGAQFGLRVSPGI